MKFSDIQNEMANKENIFLAIFFSFYNPKETFILQLIHSMTRACR